MVQPDDEEAEPGMEIYINNDYNFENEESLQIKKVEIEPAAEILTSKNGLQILIQLPGVKIENLALNVTDNHLSINAHSSNKIYKKIVDLTNEYDFDNKKISYKNYTLDIFLPFKK